MRLKKFLLEDYGAMDGGGYGGQHRSKDIEEQDIYNMCKDYMDMFKYYDKTGIRFMRGVSSSSDYAIINPSKSTRASAYTSNYYTLISSEDPSWKNIPPRNHSVVGSTGYDKAESYGNLYILVPKNGSKIAQCQSEDFWGTFQHAFGDENYPLGDFNRSLTNIFRRIDIKQPDKSLSVLKSACKEFDEFMGKEGYNQNFSKFIRDNSYDYVVFYEDVFEKFYKGDLYEMLLNVFDPKKGKIKVVKAGQELRKDVETWTDGECLMICEEYFHDILRNVIDGKTSNNTEIKDQLKDKKTNKHSGNDNDNN